MTSSRKTRLAFGLVALLPLMAHAACSSTNGDAVGSQVFDASPLDVGANPDDPDGGADGARTDLDGATDAAKDAAKDAPIVPSTAPVQISEIYVDTVLRGDATEFVELRAAPGTRVDDLKLRLIYADGTVKYEVSVGDPGEKFGANGLWVVGGFQTYKLNVLDHVDHPLSISTWGLDTRGAVQVVRGNTLLDVVGYSDDPDGGAVASPPSPPTATSEGRPALVPIQPASSSAPARSFGRKNAAADTHDNSADFCKMTATPGYLQKPCE